MLQNFRQISIFNKIFNIHGGEWAKITASWFVRLFYRLGFVIGWTLIVSTFVAKYGIFSLPYLFVLNSIFAFLGSIFYSLFIGRVKKEHLLIFTIFLCVASLVVAYDFSKTNEILYFSFLILAESIFMLQFKILFDGYIEEMFTPLEGERTFPLIESSETLGGIIAGILVVFLSGYVNAPVFVYFWIISLLFTIPFIFICETIINKYPKLEKIENDKEKVGLITKFKSEFRNFKQSSFIKGMFIIVLLQWLLFNLLEFQYTKAIYINTSHIVLDSGGGFEHAFIHNLGILFILFSTSALLIQLFAGSRLFSYLGVYGTMILHPIITLISIFGLILSFGYYTAVFAKNNFTITTVLYNNAYHNAYYGINEEWRQHTREFLEGLIRPLGALLGTIILLVFQKIFLGDFLVFSINLAMILVAFLLFVVIYTQQNRYTAAAVYDLFNSNDKAEIYNAIDILSQKGHKNYLNVFKKILFSDNYPILLRMRILRSFKENQDPEALEDLIKCLDSKNLKIKESALFVLCSYKNFDRIKKDNLALEYKLVKDLEKFYSSTEDYKIRSKIITLLSKISNIYTVDFLLNILEKNDPNLKASAIYALGNYKDKSLVYYIKPYIASQNLNQKISSIIALGRFDEYEDEVMHNILSMIYSNKNDLISSALFVIGELKMKNKKKLCLKYLLSNDINIKLNAAIALAKMECTESIPIIIELILSKDLLFAEKMKNLLEDMDSYMLNNINKIIKHIVCNELKKIGNNKNIDSFDKFSATELENLVLLYYLIEEYDYVEIINNILKIKKYE